MVRFKYLITGVLVAAVVIWTIVYLFPSEEKRIKKQFHLLENYISKDSGENTLTTVYKIKNVGILFDKTCEFEVSTYSFSGHYTPEEISGYVAQGRLSCLELHLKFYDFNINFPEQDLARVTLTARVTGKLRAGDVIDETHELESLLNKIENKWLFSKFEVVEVLKK